MTVTQKTILIVEDDMDVVRLIATHLRASGYKTIIAVDGISAVSEARNSQPDLIVLDLGLPAGDGFVVMGRLKNLMSLAPIIVVSATDTPESRQKAQEAGASVYLRKPVNTDQLLALIERTLTQ